MCVLVGLLILPGCEKKPKVHEAVTISETRRLTTADAKPKLFATSDERFQQTVSEAPSNQGDLGKLVAETPTGWTTAPASQFRLLNYRFGESGKGEAWVSLSMGSILDNTNRWLKQFGKPALDQAGLEALKHADAAGGHGVWVEAEGHYESGMGAAGQEDSALAGVVVSVKGQILTVKMVGPKDEVTKAKPALERLISTLHFAE